MDQQETLPVPQTFAPADVLVFNPPPPRPRLLVGRAILDVLIGLLAANIIGLVPVVVAMVMLFTGSHSLTTKQTEVFTKMPATDARLEKWARKQSGVESVRIQRAGNKVILRVRGRNAFGAVIPPWTDLGYTPAPTQNPYSEIMTSYMDQMETITSFPPMLLASAFSSSAGFLAIAWWRRRWVKRRGEPVLRLRDPRPGRQVGIGVIAGLAIVAFGVAYSLVVQRLVPGAQVEGPFGVVREWGWSSRIGILLLASIAAPVAEELFFRGAIYGSFAAVGRSGLGIFVSSLLFSMMHFQDPANMAAIFVVGAVLAWLYGRTGSIIAPITAHAVNNALNFGMLFAGLGS